MLDCIYAGIFCRRSCELDREMSWETAAAITRSVLGKFFFFVSLGFAVASFPATPTAAIDATFRNQAGHLNAFRQELSHRPSLFTRKTFHQVVLVALARSNRLKYVDNVPDLPISMPVETFVYVCAIRPNRRKCCCRCIAKKHTGKNDAMIS